MMCLIRLYAATPLFKSCFSNAIFTASAGRRKMPGKSRFSKFGVSAAIRGKAVQHSKFVDHNSKFLKG